MLDLNNFDEIYYRFLNIPAGDLRISITNACNMKCIYCHNEGQQNECVNFLSIDKIKFIVTNAQKYGLTKLRLTGGDPLVHPQIYEICRTLKNDLHIKNLGINTNGFQSDLLIKLCQDNLLNQVVIGMDYFDGPVSKKSPVGPSSEAIKELVLKLKRMNINVQVAIVYLDNENDIFKFIKWALNNNVLLKILEEENYYSETFDAEKYDMLILTIKDKFGLKIGLTADLKEIYLFNNQGKILFFQSHCNRGECQLCRNMHLRVNAKGMAKTCMFRSEIYDLTQEDFDFNMKRALANLGISPHGTVV